MISKLIVQDPTFLAELQVLCIRRGLLIGMMCDPANRERDAVVICEPESAKDVPLMELVGDFIEVDLPFQPQPKGH